jgi:hypothetical protein
MVNIENNIAIIPFKDDFAVDFAALNKEWLTKYFEVEPLVKKMPGNPKLNYLKKGGFIYFTLEYKRTHIKPEYKRTHIKM